MNKAKNGSYKNCWLVTGIFSLFLVGLSFVISKKLFDYLVSAASYFTFLNWILNLITYLVWLRKKNVREDYKSPLVFGKTGAYIALLIIVFMLIMSLRVADFRTGFYAAAGISLIISGTYMVLRKRIL